jgi:hypothetical protein
MLRWAFQTWLAERCRNTLFQVSHTPGGYGTVMVNVWMMTVRSYSWATAQTGSQSGSSSDISGGQIGKMPTGQSSLPQRRTSATDAWTSRPEARITLVRRSG